MICFLFLMVYQNIVSASSYLEQKIYYTSRARELARSGYRLAVNRIASGGSLPMNGNRMDFGEAGAEELSYIVLQSAPIQENIPRQYILSQGLYGREDQESGALYGGFLTTVTYQGGASEKSFQGRSHAIDFRWLGQWTRTPAIDNWFQADGVIANPASWNTLKPEANRPLELKNLSENPALMKALAEVSSSLYLLERLSYMIITKHQYVDWFLAVKDASLSQPVSLSGVNPHSKVTPEKIDGIIPDQFKADEAAKGLSDLLETGGSLPDAYMSTFGQGEGAKMLLAELYEVLYPMEGSVLIETESRYLNHVQGRPQFEGCKDVPILGEVCKDVKEYVESTTGMSYDDFLYEKINGMLNEKGYPVPGTPIPVADFRNTMEKNQTRTAPGMLGDEQVMGALTTLVYFLRILRPNFRMEDGTLRVTQYLLADGYLPLLSVLMKDMSMEQLLAEEMVPCEEVVKLIQDVGHIDIQEFEAEGATITFKGCK